MPPPPLPPPPPQPHPRHHKVCCASKLFYRSEELTYQLKEERRDVIEKAICQSWHMYLLWTTISLIFRGAPHSCNVS